MSHFKEIFEEAGYKLTDYGDHWRTAALYRGGNNKSAMVISKKNGHWVDFGSADYGSMTAPSELLKLTLHINDEEAKKIVGSGEVTASSKVETFPLKRGERIVDLDYLEDLLPHYDFYTDPNKGIKEETLKFFRGGYCMSDEMYQRFVFPIFNEFGIIHGLSGRDVKGNKKIKWKHLGLKNKWAYPFYMFDSNGNFPCQEAIEETKKVYLVESIGDMLKLWERGHKNVIVIFGLSLSGTIINLLSRHIGLEVYICTNNDSQKGKKENRGLWAAVRHYTVLRKYFDNNKVFIKLPVKNDFGDMNEIDFQKWEDKIILSQNQIQYLKSEYNWMVENKVLPKAILTQLKKLW